ncbi:MAG: hypothetical protein WDW38_001924 [Sanguina aurantia]
MLATNSSVAGPSSSRSQSWQSIDEDGDDRTNNSDDGQDRTREGWSGSRNSSSVSMRSGSTRDGYRSRYSSENAAGERSSSMSGDTSSGSSSSSSQEQLSAVLSPPWCLPPSQHPRCRPWQCREQRILSRRDLPTKSPNPGSFSEALGLSRCCRQMLWHRCKQPAAPDPPTFLCADRSVAVDPMTCPATLASAKSHATVSWALVRLGVQPPAFWVEDFMKYALPALGRPPGDTDGLAFSNTAWALSNWRVAPPHAWLARFTSAAARVLPRLTPHSSAVLATGLADLGARPAAPWVSLMLESFHRAAVGSRAGPRPLQPPPQHSAHPGRGPVVDRESGARGSEEQEDSSQQVRRSGGGGPSASCSDIVAVLFSASRFLAPPLQERPEDWRPDRKWLLRYRPLLADLADASRWEPCAVWGPDGVVGE